MQRIGTVCGQSESALRNLEFSAGHDVALLRAMSRDPNQLRVFQVADELVLDIYNATKNFPPEERYGLQAQIRRAAISVPTNLVEGSARRGEREYLNFCNIACGSAQECRYLVKLSRRLGFMAQTTHEALDQKLAHLCKALTRLVMSLEP
jgi:four helix bundle protein